MTVTLQHFVEPPSEREVLRYALNNILTDYGEERPAFPFDEEDPKLDTLTDHRTNFGGNYSQLVSRLNNRFKGTSFVANSDDHLELEDLVDILTDTTASYPIVEVHPELYEYQAQNDKNSESYLVQRGHHDDTLVPLLIPFSVEEGAVFYYDPFLDFYSSDGHPTQEISRGIFIELWGRCDLTSWALWIDQGQQRTLMDISGAQS